MLRAYFVCCTIQPFKRLLKKMKIAIASDHAGYTQKEALKPLLRELGLEFEDLGTVSEASVDYPDYAAKVARAVANGEVDQGLLVCSSGTGMAISANKVPGVRAAVAWSEQTARLARQHNDANVLALGAHTTPSADIPNIVKTWFETPFEGGRHSERVNKISRLEQEREAEGGRRKAEGGRQEAEGRRQKAEGS